MAIDPTAPIAPMIPAMPVGDAADQSKALLALARAAVASNASVLGEIAVSGTGAGAGAAPTAGLSTHSVPGPAGATPVETPPPAAPSTGERITMAVRSAAAQAAPRQSGLAPMMANLDAAMTWPETPEPVRQAARAVLDKALPTTQPLTATVLREAVQSSGVFLEARLARATPAPAQMSPALPQTDMAGGDMKAALLVLRAVVSTWLAKAPAVSPAEPRDQASKAASDPVEPGRPATPPPPQSSGAYAPPPGSRAEARAALPMTPFDDAAEPAGPPPVTVQAPVTASRPAPVSLAPGSDPAALAVTEEPAVDVAEVAPKIPAQGVRPAPSTPTQPMLMVGVIEEEEEVVEAATLVEDDEGPSPAPRTGAYGSVRSQAPSRPPPPYAGGPTTAQAAVQSDLPKEMAPADLARRLLKDVGGAIARQELSQIASLPEGHNEAERPVETKSSRWVFDLPFQTPQGVAVAQFEINKDGGGGAADGGREAERTWRARFSLDVEPLGPVHVQVALTGVMTRVGLWAERPEAVARLRAGEEALNAALRQAELTPEVAFHAGSPAAALTAPGRFVDRAT